MPLTGSTKAKIDSALIKIRKKEYQLDTPSADSISEVFSSSLNTHFGDNGNHPMPYEQFLLKVTDVIGKYGFNKSNSIALVSQ